MPSNLPDPLEESDRLPLDNVDEILTRLADQEITRLIGPNGTQYDLEPVRVDPDPPPVASRATPVQELNAQLGNFFDKMRDREPVPPPPARVLEEDEASPAPLDREIDRASDRLSRSALIAPIEEPLPAYLRALAWLNSPVIEMPPLGRLAVSIVSILSFAGSVWALTYVLMLRHG